MQDEAKHRQELGCAINENRGYTIFSPNCQCCAAVSGMISSQGQLSRSI